MAFNLFNAPPNNPTSFGFGAGSAAHSPSKVRSPPIGGANEIHDKHSNLALKLGSDVTLMTSPDSLMTTLMPAVLKQWTTFLHRLDKAVNIDGRMFSQEVVLAWARALETTGSGEGAASSSSFVPVQAKKDEPKSAELVIRRAMDEVRGRLERDLAWLVKGAPYHNTPITASRALPKKEKRARSSSMSDGEEL
jgi:hypothetical protein